MQLLLVDDDPLAAHGLALAHSDEGFRIKIAHNGREVFGLVRLLEPALVILDVTLPDMDGVAVATLLRRHWIDLPIVFTTGHDEYEGLAPLLGPSTRLLQKPFELVALLALIRELTSREDARGV